MVLGVAKTWRIPIGILGYFSFALVHYAEKVSSISMHLK